jgi:hypothetical protein
MKNIDYCDFNSFIPIVLLSMEQQATIRTSTGKKIHHRRHQKCCGIQSLLV